MRHYSPICCVDNIHLRCGLETEFLHVSVGRPQVIRIKKTVDILSKFRDIPLLIPPHNCFCSLWKSPVLVQTPSQLAARLSTRFRNVSCNATPRLEIIHAFIATLASEFWECWVLVFNNDGMGFWFWGGECSVLT